MNRVKQFRKDQGLSQLKLTQKIGVARQTINLIENVVCKIKLEK
ncbi:hypothetical protein DN446_02000 [Lactobacillus reuteri]|nr:hypothetical protein [Limosilactobacillus reuteri]